MAEAVEMVGDPANPSTLVIDPGIVENPVLGFFLNYWRTKRGGAALPMRNSFVPQEVRGNLPWVVVVDALQDFSDFRYRVVGSHVARYFLGNSTGKTAREAFEAWGSEAVDDVVSLYARACTARAPVRLTGPAISLKKLLLPDFDTLYLPYSSDGEIPDRIVNIFTFNPRSVEARRSSGGLSG
jgi:hypothetical protein